jgi:hypothetical protein
MLDVWQTLREYSGVLSAALSVSETEFHRWVTWMKKLQNDMLAGVQDYSEHEMVQVC